ncbi:hypothetical protein PanWU01x14_261270 [Parasponia andersonii]|uniref:Uncharacterized protein n=1 Tax=Parasponia andersonii TaxID=3476 RepID=A0A2P5B8H0_PARAD|nr:hypothetical protein PanWU01x14_261270 [Parasponia andersonii]
MAGKEKELPENSNKKPEDSCSGDCCHSEGFAWTRKPMQRCLGATTSAIASCNLKTAGPLYLSKFSTDGKLHCASRFLDRRRFIVPLETARLHWSMILERRLQPQLSALIATGCSAQGAGFLGTPALNARARTAIIRWTKSSWTLQREKNGRNVLIAPSMCRGLQAVNPLAAGYYH